MKKFIKLSILTVSAFLFMQCANDDNNSNNEPLTVTDIDGNVYNTITIGTQVWMLENLKVTTLNDGTPLTEYSFDEFGINWLNLNDPNTFYQWPDTSDFNNAVDFDLSFDYYGAMYNHLAIESGKLAPEGWRIPSEQDFRDLENYLANNGFEGNEATALKSTSGWVESTGSGTDAVGFRALPNGYISAVGTSTFPGGICTWATTDKNIDNTRRILVSLFDEPTIQFDESGFSIGAGIRCIKN